MAEALVAVILDQLSSVIQQEVEHEVKLVAGVHKQVKNLTTTLTMLQPFLKNADLKQMKNEAVKVWLDKLIHIAYDADDVLDSWHTRILLSQLNPVTHSIIKKINHYFCSPLCCFDGVVLPYPIGNHFQEISEHMGRIAHDSARLNLDVSQIDQYVLPRPATSSVDVAEIRGHDDHKKFITNWLLAESSPQEFRMPIPVFSIVGNSGFGKTTLARLIFDQEHVKIRFELTIWVCISEPFDRERVAKKIIEQTTGEKDRKYVSWNALHHRLSDVVKGKGFLIVLDNFCSKDPNNWTPLKLSLYGGAPGSKIVVTTQDEGVAEMMGSSTIRLEELSEQDGWLLFQQIAFDGRTKMERETLEEIGKEIANKCNGVPIAIKTIASLMQFKQTESDWRNVLENDVWKMPPEEDGFLPSLTLSYDGMPSELKRCFLYCAVFPKDAIIEKDMLVKLWMAQGVFGFDAEKELEMIGEEYFDDLATRSFFHSFQNNHEGKIIAFKMHDLVHDFAKFLTKTECLILEKDDGGLDSSNFRHINANFQSLSSLMVRKLRTLILRRSTLNLSPLFVHLTCLRSLDMSFYQLESLPDEVERLSHLRYLDLSGTKLLELPKSLCNLYNLQTLKLNNCDRLNRLPEGTEKLLNLRHLEVEYTNLLVYFPQGFGKLKHLRTLSKFLVSNASGGCKLEELRDLNFIRDKLRIVGLRQVETPKEAKRAELQKKKNIVSLVLEFYETRQNSFSLVAPVSENENDMKKRMGEIIEGLQPHSDLKELTIRGYPGLAFPLWMSTLSNIVKLVLYRCQNCTRLPALGTLASLERLDICDLRSLQQVGVEFLGISDSEIQPQTAFPKLKELIFNKMDEWEEWNLPLNQNKILPCLQSLRFIGCPKLKALPGAISKLPSLDYLHLEYLPWSSDILGIFNQRGFVNGDSVSLSTSTSLQLLFPKLKTLSLGAMINWEEEIHETTASTISIMPGLGYLYIWSCKKLKVIPNYYFSHTLNQLEIHDCPNLIGFQPCILPSLNYLDLVGNVGVFSTSLMSVVQSNTIHSLKSIRLYKSPHSSLPQGLNHFTSLQELDIRNCKSIDFNPEVELSSEHFPFLTKLRISGCPLMLERCSKVNWSVLSHITDINVD